jgi:hypothetical protein
MRVEIIRAFAQTAGLSLVLREQASIPELALLAVLKTTRIAISAEIAGFNCEVTKRSIIASTNTTSESRRKKDDAWTGSVISILWRSRFSLLEAPFCSFLG